MLRYCRSGYCGPFCDSERFCMAGMMANTREIVRILFGWCIIVSFRSLGVILAWAKSHLANDWRTSRAGFSPPHDYEVCYAVIVGEAWVVCDVFVAVCRFLKQLQRKTGFQESTHIVGERSVVVYYLDAAPCDLYSSLL